MTTRTHPRIVPRHEPRRSARLLAPLLLLAVLLGACSSDEEDPAAADRRRILERLEETFSGDQAACILDELDTEVIERLLETDDLAGHESELWIYSAAVRDCVITEVVEIEPPPDSPDGTTDDDPETTDDDPEATDPDPEDG